MKAKFVVCLAAWGVASALIVACSKDTSSPAAVAPGSVGESCQVHADCSAGLSCVHQVCVDGNSTGTHTKDGGAPAVTFLGEVGESCSSRADCRTGLACINDVCTDTSVATTDAGARLAVGKRGESCRTRADCETGLACIAGTCTLANFGITPTDKKCVLVECKAPADCCPKPSANCSFYNDFCLQGDPSYCSLYDQLCVCDATEWDCTKNQCTFKPKCDQVTTTCPSPLICSGGLCVECAVDADCGVGSKCTAQQCVTVCAKDGDCADFEKCLAGACVKGGCSTNRECIAKTGNVLSSCDITTGDCLVPCETDLECDSAINFGFQACINGFCRDVGCETDQECRLLLNPPFGSTADAVCQ